MLNVLYIHGLNTYGDDDLHIGPLRLKPMSDPWVQALQARQCRVIRARDFGAHDPETQADLIANKIQRESFASDCDHLHLIGHSIGGLTARVLATHPDLRHLIRTVITIGSPHHGARVAEFGLRFETRYPRLYSLCKWFGYDTSIRAEIFRHFTPEEVTKFNSRHPLPENIRCAHALCELNRKQLSLPLLPLYDHLHPNAVDRGASDGFIHSRSQAWGNCLGRFCLDHFGNQGFFLHISGKRRREARAEFERLVDTVVAWMRASDPI